MDNKRVWTMQEEILALYLYTAEKEKSALISPKDMDELSGAFGISMEDMMLRMDDFRCLDGKGGRGDVATQTKKVFDAYGRLSAERLMAILSKGGQ